MTEDVPDDPGDAAKTVDSDLPDASKSTDSPSGGGFDLGEFMTATPNRSVDDIMAEHGLHEDPYGRAKAHVLSIGDAIAGVTRLPWIAHGFLAIIYAILTKRGDGGGGGGGGWGGDGQAGGGGRGADGQPRGEAWGDRW